MNARLRRPAVALITTTLAVGALGFVPAAEAVTTSTVSGTITGAGARLNDVDVRLYTYVDQYGGYWTQTDYSDDTVDGAYSITAPEGSYRIGFQDESGAFVEEYFDNAPEVDSPGAQTVSLTAASPVVADADLSVAAHITGAVSDASGGLEEQLVVAFREVEEDGYTDYEYAGAAFTQPDGSYDVGGLSAGTYRLQFGGFFFFGPSGYATEYYNDQPSVESAEDIVLAGAQVRGGVNAQLAPDATISGTVVDAAGDPVSNGSVEVLVKAGNRWDEVGYADVETNGTYAVDGLMAGTYRVRFDGTVDGEYEVEFWNNVGRLGNASDIVLTTDQDRLGINAELVVGEHDAEESAVANTALPTVSGAPVVGQTLTATTGSWFPEPRGFEYLWFRDGQYIEGAESPTYTLTAADLGAKISVGVFASARYYDYGYAESVPVGPITNPVVAPPVVTPPVVTPPAPVVDVPAGLAAVLKGVDTSGKPEVGKTIKVTGLDAMFRASTSVSYKFQWLAGKKAIKKATKSKLKITKAMKGKKIAVKVTATAGSTSKSITLKVGKVS